MAGFKSTSIGKLADLGNYENGKVFTKEDLGATGTEVSFQLMPAGVQTPFFHKHKENEETYIFLSGEGKMQLDDEVVDVAEGTLIRVAPPVMRCIKAVSDLTYICIQAKEGSLHEWTGEDGVLGEYPSKL
jgi:mannose-6-phosphate isomerase-like protein (cupin superfamily)